MNTSPPNKNKWVYEETIVDEKANSLQDNKDKQNDKSAPYDRKIYLEFPNTNKQNVNALVKKFVQRVSHKFKVKQE